MLCTKLICTSPRNYHEQYQHCTNDSNHRKIFYLQGKMHLPYLILNTLGKTFYDLRNQRSEVRILSGVFQSRCEGPLFIAFARLDHFQFQPKLLFLFPNREQLGTNLQKSLVPTSPRPRVLTPPTCACIHQQLC
jgi:hypothetical protein